MDIGHDESSKKRLEKGQDKDGNVDNFRAIKGHSGGIPIIPELMEYTPIPNDWNTFFTEKAMGFSVDSGEWRNSGRKRGGQSSLSCLSDSIGSFWKGPGTGEASFRSHSSPPSST